MGSVARRAGGADTVVGVADDRLRKRRGSGMIELERLTKRYGAFTAVDDLSRMLSWRTLLREVVAT